MGSVVAGEGLSASGVEIEGQSRKVNNNQGEKDDLYTELWHACAGPLVYVPRAGDKVFYFPQGHIEQVKEYMDQDGQMEIPIYNLPPKILCKVVHVQLKAEAYTDEVVAQVILLPEAKQDEPTPEDGEYLPLPRSTRVRSFSKTLTRSDTSTHGGFSVHKRHADECLPPLDMSKHPPAQGLVAKDLHGFEWHFRHIFRGQPKRHLLTSGWSTFVTSKKLVAGNAFIFLRGDDGQLRVGVRRTKLQNNSSTSVISGHSMQHGILASAFHAFISRTTFTAYYRPWTSPEFIIPFDEYMKSTEIEYSVGMRFKMQLEGEECGVKRFSGTVVGTEDIDHIRWPHSEWRCLHVKWDATSNTVVCPERVSPWHIEPLELPKKNSSILRKVKGPHALDPSSPMFSGLAWDGSMRSSGRYTPQGQYEDLQGQEKKDTGLGALVPTVLPYLFPQPYSDWGHRHLGLENQLPLLMHDPFRRYPGSTISFPGGNTATSGLPHQLPPAFASYGVCDNVGVRRNLSSPNVDSNNSGSKQWRAFDLKGENETPLAQPIGSGSYMLFGVNLADGPPELPSQQVAHSSGLQSLCSLPPISQSSVSETVQVSELSRSNSGICSGKQCKNCCSVSNRHCTKVRKYGIALVRSVDLARFDGYDDLIFELDHMFDFKGSLIDGSSGWYITYTDDDGDMMLIGDNQWQEFRRMVRRMLICPKEDIDNLYPSSPNSTPL